MPNFDIDSYRANFQGGARQYLFYVKPSFPAGIALADTNIATYLVRTSTLPETTHEEIMTQWQGFDYKFAGKYTYADWTITFNVDSGADIQRMFANWMSLIHDPTTNMYSTPATYTADQQIELLGFDSKPILKYKLINAWPKSMATATLDYSSNDVVQFDVTWSYTYHVIDKGTYGKAVTFA